MSHHLIMKLHMYGIPEYMAEGIEMWMEHGIAPGGFLMAVVSNDLKGARAHADETNRDLLPNYCKFFYNEAPSRCWGSKENVADWQQYVASLRAQNKEEATGFVGDASPAREDK